MATKAAVITEKSIPTKEKLAAPEFADEVGPEVEYVEEQLAAPDGQILVPVILVIAYVLAQLAPSLVVCTVAVQPVLCTAAAVPSGKPAIIVPPE